MCLLFGRDVFCALSSTVQQPCLENPEILDVKTINGKTTMELGKSSYVTLIHFWSYLAGDSSRLFALPWKMSS